MLRLVLSAIALAIVLATAHPAAADPRAATASEHVRGCGTRGGADGTIGTCLVAVGCVAPTTADRNKDVPVGFGWG